MASKEATVYILDVGPTLKAKREGSNVSRLEETKAVLLKLLANKVHMNRKTVYVSVILVGSNRTNNELATVDEDGSAEYQFVDVLQPLDIATLELMKGVQNDVEYGETMGDCMDGLIVAMDMMTKFCKRLKYEKKVYILTDACAEINKNEDDAATVQGTLRDGGIQLNVIGTDFDSEGGTEQPKTQMQKENELFFKEMCEAASGNVFSLDEALELTNEFHTKKVKPTAVYRGTLDLGDPESHPDSALSIPVHMFPITMPVKLPTAKKYSMLSESAAADDMPEGHTGIVNMSRTYKLKVTADMAGEDMDVDTEVAADDLEKAYMYGKTIVPIRAVDLDAYKLRTTKSLTILGFFSASTFKRDWLMANTYAVFPAPADPRAEVEIAGLLFGMFEKNSYALCRYVRAEDAEPKLAILWPEITAETKCFYFGQVAFQEDVRQFFFTSLTEVKSASGKTLEKHRLLATPEMVSAAKDFLNALDLMTAEDGEEYLAPESTFNPAVQRHKQLVEFRALNPTAEFPPVPAPLIKQLLPRPDLLDAAQDYADTLIRLWDIKKVEKPVGKRGYGASLEDGKDGVAQLSGVGGTEGSLFDGLATGQNNNKRHKSESVFGTATSGSVAAAGFVPGSGSVSVFGQGQGDLAASGMVPFEMASVREVGTSDPVKDFQALVRIAIINTQQGVRPAGAGWISVSLAVEQMKAMVLKLISTSFGDQLYEKAIDCLKSLRAFLSHADFADVAMLAGRQEDDNETIQDRVTTWNAFIKEVKHMCLQTSTSPQRTDFWEMLVKQHKTTLGLLTTQEVPVGAGGVSEAEAEQFWEQSQDASLEVVAPVEDEQDEDDLLALMD